MDALRTVRAPRRRSLHNDDKAAAGFLLPWGLGLLVITIGPMLASLYLSFTKFNLLQPPVWIGLGNYTRMFADPRLLNSLGVTFSYVFISVPLQLALALALALLLDKGVRGLAFYRSVFYLPSLLGSSVAIAILWKRLFGADGLLNQFLGFFGIEGQAWISDPSTALGTLITLNVWTFGAPMVIFLAGLRQIPTMYYEAAIVDGAGKIRQFWQHHAAAAVADHLLQPGAAGHPLVPVLHPGLRGLRGERRAGRLDHVLHALPVPARLRPAADGLRLGHGLGAAADHRRAHRDQLLLLEAMGLLR